VELSRDGVLEGRVPDAIETYAQSHGEKDDEDDQTAGASCSVVLHRGRRGRARLTRHWSLCNGHGVSGRMGVASE